jgi:hypothetical protein
MVIIADIERACAKLIAAFPYHMDHRHYDEIVGLFTPDGIFERPGVVTKGHDELRRMLINRPTQVATCHICGPTVFTSVSPDSVHSVTYFSLYSGEIPVSGFPSFDRPAAIAEYHDTFTPTDCGWRFASRKAVVVMVART